MSSVSLGPQGGGLSTSNTAVHAFLWSMAWRLSTLQFHTKCLQNAFTCMGSCRSTCSFEPCFCTCTYLSSFVLRPSCLKQFVCLFGQKLVEKERSFTLSMLRWSGIVSVYLVSFWTGLDPRTHLPGRLGKDRSAKCTKQQRIDPPS